MKNTEAASVYNKHFVALSLLFILGNAVITLPQKNADKFTFLGFLISFLLSLLLYFTVFLIPISKPVMAVAFAVSFWAAADTLLSFLKFINQTLLRDTAKILIVLPLAFVIFIFAKVSKTALFKFSLISAFFSVIAVIFFFIFTAKDFDIGNIIIKSLPSLKNLYSQTCAYIKTVTLPSLLLVIYAKITQKNKKTAYLGLISGNVLLAACILNSVLLFGSKFSGRLDFPYASAISTVTFGNLFTRMDGFAYFIYFASCIVKITVCINIMKNFIKRITHYELRITN